MGLHPPQTLNSKVIRVRLAARPMAPYDITQRSGGRIADVRALTGSCATNDASRFVSGRPDGSLSNVTLLPPIATGTKVLCVTPAILRPEDYQRWLFDDCGAALKAIGPYPAQVMQAQQLGLESIALAMTIYQL